MLSLFLMSSSNNESSEKNNREEQSQDTEEMEVDPSAYYQHTGSVAGRSSRSRQTSSGVGLFDYLPNPFQQQEEQQDFQRLEPSMFQPHPYYASPPVDYHPEHVEYSYQYPEPHHQLRNPSGMGSLRHNPPTYDHTISQNLDISQDPSFDLGLGLLETEHLGSIHSIFQQANFPPHNTDGSTAALNDDNIDERKPAAIDPPTRHHDSMQRSHPQMFPTQERNFRSLSTHPPPAAAQNDSHLSYSPDSSEDQLPLTNRSYRRSKRNFKPPPVASLSQGKSRPANSEGTKNESTIQSRPRKGPRTQSKLPRPSTQRRHGPADANIFSIPASPNAQELEDARTPRKKQALFTWYQRLNELVEYKRRHGHTNVPQQFEDNHSLGIWVNKQRMEKKAMEAGEKSSMTMEKVRLLEKAGFIWAKRKGQAAWEDKFRELQQFQKEHGHCDVPTKNKKNRALGRWVSTQRSNYKKYKKGEGNLRPKTDELEMERRIWCLEGIGFKWSLLPNSSSNDEEDDGNDINQE